MSQYFEIHPTNPQLRLVHQAVEIIDAGGVIAYPTDSSYALGCHIGDKKALERVRRIRKIDDKHNMTLVCSDLSEISTYAKLNNSDYRMLKSLTPGPYTFILNATHEVPRRLMHSRRRTIGIRVVDHRQGQARGSDTGEETVPARHRHARDSRSGAPFRSSGRCSSRSGGPPATRC